MLNTTKTPYPITTLGKVEEIIWVHKKFEDCLDKINYTTKIQRKDFLENGKFPIVSQEQEFTNGYWDNEGDLFKVKKPVVIFGDHTQVLKFIDFNFVLGADGVKILQPKTAIDSKYFYYFMQSINLKSLGYARHYRLLKEIIVFYPPLQEQQRIVAVLDQAMEAISQSRANAKTNLLNSKELFENYLQSVFTNKGNDWQEKTLGEMATFRNGMNFTKGSKGEIIKIVGVGDFQKSFWVPLESLENATLDGKLNDIDFLKEGDILAVRSNGNPQLIGRTLLAGNVVGKVSHSGFTIRIRLNSNIVSSLYLCHYLKNQKVRKELVESGNGVGIKSLNQGSLSSLCIPFPKSIKDQHDIISKVEAMQTETKKLETIYKAKLADLDELSKSLLQKAFGGEI